MLLGGNPQAVAAQWTAFLASLQLGSLAALGWYFRQDLKQVASAVWAGPSAREGRRLGLAIVVGTLPIGVFGLLLKPVIEGPLTKEPLLIAGALGGGSLVMALGEFRRGKRQLADIGWREALLIGLGQVLALLPGSSRSGMTLAAGMLLGVQRADAARFAFLLGIPAIAASGGLELMALLRHGSAFSWQAFGGSFLAAFLSSYAAIAFLLRYVRSHSLWVFILYRLVLAGGVLIGVFHTA
jgi:undecaprenyl-diphosphatase